MFSFLDTENGRSCAVGRKFPLLVVLATPPYIKTVPCAACTSHERSGAGFQCFHTNLGLCLPSTVRPHVHALMIKHLITTGSVAVIQHVFLLYMLL